MITDYGQFFLDRVSKTEERMEMENKSISNILSQARQVETQLVNNQEKLSAKESQLHLQVQKLQEEVTQSFYHFLRIFPSKVYIRTEHIRQ